MTVADDHLPQARPLPPEEQREVHQGNGRYVTDTARICGTLLYHAADRRLAVTSDPQ